MSNKTGASTPVALGLVDTVHLTGDAVHLQQADQVGAESPDFDAQRVAKARVAISDGSYVIDSEQIAAKLARMDWALNNQ